MSDVIDMELWRRNQTRTNPPDIERLPTGEFLSIDTSEEPDDEPDIGPDEAFNYDAERTDIGNAERFNVVFGERCRYVNELGWMVYDGRRWAHDRQQKVMALAIQVAKSIADPEWRAKSQTRARLRAMLSIAESMLPGSMSHLDRDPWLFNCANGTLDLRSGELLPQLPDHAVTKLSPVAYDPAAPSELWQKFVARIMNNDSELIDYLQRCVGYSLTGMTGEQCLFFCLGGGKNGKSVFVETIQALFGEYGMNSTTQTVMKRSGGMSNDIARLAGARFVSLNETGEGQAFNEPLLKDLTGGDTMTGRFLFKEFFDFTPQCKLWIRGNHQPLIKGTDDGVWRRFRVIPFGVQIPDGECDPQLLEKLKDELPGILRWAVDGCLKWQAVGLKPPKVVVDAVALYRKESDPLGQFLEDVCVLDPDAVVPATPLYQAYRAWATTCGEQRMSQTLFGRSLRSRGFKKGKVSVKVYYGIALKGR